LSPGFPFLDPSMNTETSDRILYPSAHSNPCLLYRAARDSRAHPKSLRRVSALVVCVFSMESKQVEFAEKQRVVDAYVSNSVPLQVDKHPLHPQIVQDSGLPAYLDQKHTSSSPCAGLTTQQLTEAWRKYATRSSASVSREDVLSFTRDVYRRVPVMYRQLLQSTGLYDTKQESTEAVYRLLPELLPGTENKFAQYFVRDCLQVDSAGHYSLDAFVAAWNEQVSV
jgi:hypothetical protein